VTWFCPHDQPPVRRLRSHVDHLGELGDPDEVEARLSPPGENCIPIQSISTTNRTLVERKALVRPLWFEGVGQLAWREVEDLVVGHPLEAIVRPVASTSCDLDRDRDRDRAIVLGLVSLGNGFPIGHECVAEVLEVSAAGHRVAVGDLVVVPWHYSCGVCPTCRNALPTARTTVPGLQGYGASITGDWGDCSLSKRAGPVRRRRADSAARRG